MRYMGGAPIVHNYVGLCVYERNGDNRLTKISHGD